MADMYEKDFLGACQGCDNWTVNEAGDLECLEGLAVGYSCPRNGLKRGQP